LLGTTTSPSHFAPTPKISAGCGSGKERLLHELQLSAVSSSSKRILDRFLVNAKGTVVVRRKPLQETRVTSTK